MCTKYTARTNRCSFGAKDAVLIASGIFSFITLAKTSLGIISSNVLQSSVSEASKMSLWISFVQSNKFKMNCSPSFTTSVKLCFFIEANATCEQFSISVTWLWWASDWHNKTAKTRTRVRRGRKRKNSFSCQDIVQLNSQKINTVLSDAIFDLDWPRLAFAVEACAE